MAKILVIDDDDIVNGMIVQLLSEAGYDAVGAQDGDRGLKLVETESFDMIVTDIVMPKKEGLETILELRKKNKMVPIIAISGGGKINADEYLLVAKGLGAKYTFKKPFDNKAFLNAVRVCLSGT